MYFGLQEAKPPPCPLLLTKQGGSIQCMIFISGKICNMILHIYRHHQMFVIALREDRYRGMSNKQYVLMCGIFQYSNLSAIKVFLSMYQYSSQDTLFGRALMGS
jgi:hypothetical protein